MMLRASAHVQDKKIDITAIAGDPVTADSEIEFGEELIAFAEAVLAPSIDDSLALARARLGRVAGDAVVVDTAGVIANFQRMVRIADSTGIPVDSLDETIRDSLNLSDFPSAANSGQ